VRRVLRGELWSNPDFLLLWAGQTISLAGSQIGGIALPLVAILTLNATTFQLGVLRGLGTLPYFLIALPAGVWVDRLRRRPVLI
jgi:MFS family permease